MTVIHNVLLLDIKLCIFLLLDTCDELPSILMSLGICLHYFLRIKFWNCCFLS